MLCGKMKCSAWVVGVVIALSATASRAEVLTVTGDQIYAIWNTVAGGDSTTSTEGSGAGNYYPGCGPEKAIDGSVDTKYLNTDVGYNPSYSSLVAGENTGFYVTPSKSTTVLTGVQIATANDVSQRDPLTITIEGSNATGDDLTLGSSWTLLYSGTSGLDTDPGRKQWGESVSIANSTAYSSYRLLVTSKRGVNYCTQHSEVALTGYVVPEPSSMTLLSLGLLGLLAYTWRRHR